MEIRTKKEERKEKGFGGGADVNRSFHLHLSLFNGARGSKEKDN